MIGIPGFFVFDKKSIVICSSSSSQPLVQAPLPGIDPDRHLHLPKGVLADEIRISLINTLHQDIGVGHARIREQQELSPAESLEHRQAEKGRLHGLNARRRDARLWIRPIAGRGARGGGDGYSGRQGACDGVHTVECTGQDEVVIRRESAGAWQA